MSSRRVVQSCRIGLFVVDTIRVQRVGDGNGDVDDTEAE